MKKVCIALLYLIPILGFGQEWAPIGAKWYYDKTYASFPGVDSYIVYCDTVVLINDIECKRINIDLCACNNHFCDKLYTFERNDSVFFYNSDIDSFQILYDFSAKSGDSWEIYTIDYDKNIDTVILQIDSTSTVIINDTELVKQYVTYKYNYDSHLKTEVQSEVIQKLGDLEFIINILDKGYWVCDMDFLNSLRCYTDQEFGLYSTGVRESCDYVYIWTTIDPKQENNAFRIFPNPTKDYLLIESVSTTYLSYTLWDINGVKILNGNEPRLDLSSLKTGIYFLIIKGENNDTMTFKISKHLP